MIASSLCRMRTDTRRQSAAAIHTPDCEACMIGSSIVALSLLLQASTANVVAAPSSSATPVSATPVGATTQSAPTRSTSWMPSVHMPHISMPKFHFPHRTKKANAGDPMDITSRRLTAMVTEQEKFYSDNGRYSNNGYKVAGNATRQNASFETVQVQVLSADKKGWTAMASHPDAPGKSCVIYVGYRSAIPIIPRTRLEAIDATAEAKPACDK